jgi:hypothetical protein
VFENILVDQKLYFQQIFDTCLVFISEQQEKFEGLSLYQGKEIRNLTSQTLDKLQAIGVQAPQKQFDLQEMFKEI